MTPRAWVDVNCDVGEGAGLDDALLPHVTSANIACGAHAGSLKAMREACRLANELGVAIGAHPGFADREHFGRRELALSPEEIGALVFGQVSALREMATVVHVKPHGGLYSRAARDDAAAEAVAAAVLRSDPDLILVGSPGSRLIAAGSRFGLRVAAEGFADRVYRGDGLLVPRGEPGAVLSDDAAAVEQVLRLLREGVVRTVDGGELRFGADTICVHGDNPACVKIARRLKRELQAAGIGLRPLRAAR